MKKLCPSYLCSSRRVDETGLGLSCREIDQKKRNVELEEIVIEIVDIFPYQERDIEFYAVITKNLKVRVFVLMFLLHLSCYTISLISIYDR